MWLAGGFLVYLIVGVPFWVSVLIGAIVTPTNPVVAQGRPVLLGWFRPVGAAALYYAAFSLRESGIEAAWTVGSLVICASVLVHGITATPLTKLYGRLPRGR